MMTAKTDVVSLLFSFECCMVANFRGFRVAEYKFDLLFSFECCPKQEDISGRRFPTTIQSASHLAIFF